MSEQMTKRDREQLAQVAKMRSRVAKASVEQRELVLRSQVEDELQAVFAAEDDLAAKGEEIAMDLARRANTELVEKLDELKIPDHFRPQIGVAKVESLLRPRQESNASRRITLRTIAGARIKTLGAAAKVEVDRQCADTVERLITGGLSTEEAQKFLDEMPTIDELMMAPSVAELEAVHDEQRRQRRELGSGW